MENPHRYCIELIGMGAVGARIAFCHFSQRPKMEAPAPAPSASSMAQSSANAQLLDRFYDAFAKKYVRGLYFPQL